MKNFYIDTLGVNLKIHDNVAATDFWLQPGIEGLDAPEYRTGQYDKPGEDGSIISSQFYSGRVVTLPGIVKGNGAAAYEANRKLLSSALTIKRDSNGRPIPKRCQFETLSGVTYFFDAYVARKPMFSQVNVSFSKFLINLVVPKASIFATGIVTSGAITRPSGGGFILPVILPITSSSSTGGSATLTNNGDNVSLPTLTLTGPLTNPYIRNATINKSMQLTYTIGTGDYITIDMEEKTILLNGSSSVLSAKTDDSEWWGIDPGVNNIIFSSGSNSDTGNLQVSFYEAYAGI